MKDFVSGDNNRYIDALPDDYISDTNIRRVTHDQTVNENGYNLIDFFRHTGLRIAIGRIGEDAEVGKCTYVGNAGTSLIDYVIVSEKLFPSFSTLYICDPNIVSDHCVIDFALNMCNMGDEI